MPGPAPKNSLTRQRTNRKSTAARLAVGARAEAPELPEREGGWHPMTAAWWADVWRSPMAGEYVYADRHGLFRLALLVEDFWRAGSPTARKDLAGEIRLQGQAFGLSPIDRRRLDWQLSDEGPAAVAQRKSSAGTADPRKVLRAVR